MTESADRVVFGPTVRQRRTERGWSLRDLAERVTFNRGYIGKLLTASARDSLRLITPVEEQLDLSGLDGGVRDLAVAYLGSPPGPMLVDGVALRSEALRRLQQRQHRPHELADLYVALGRIQGVLSYAALDLGDSQVAMVHAEAAWQCAEHADDTGLP